MGLLAPLGLLGLLALPAIIALYFLKYRRPERQVTAPWLWTALHLDRAANAWRQPFRPSLLMLLQLLVALALALALARPFIPAPTRTAANLVILLDGSGTMQATDLAPNRFAKAVAEAEELVADLPAGGRASVILLTRSPEILIAAEADRGRVRKVLREARPSAGEADLGEGLALATALLGGRPDGQIAVIGSGHFRGAEGLAPSPVPVTYIPVGGPAPNLAVALLTARQVGGAWSAFALIQNGGPTEASGAVELWLDQKLAAVETVTVPAGESRAVSWPIPGAAKLLSVRIPGGDALALDNQAWLPVTGATGGRVLLVSEGNPFLERALKLIPGVTLTQVKPADFKAGGQDLYIFDRFTPTALPAGGHFLLIDPPGTGEVRPVGPVTGRTDDPLLANVDSSEVLVAQARRHELPTGARVLWTGPDGLPLLWLEGESKAVFSFSLQASDLPLRTAFPILMNRLVDTLLPGAPVPPGGLQPGEAVRVRPWPSATALEWLGPNGERQRFELGPDSPPPTLVAGRPGLWTVRQETPDGERLTPVAVNLFAGLVSEMAPAAALKVPVLPEAGSVPTEAPLPLWRWLGWLALGVALFEWWAWRGFPRPRWHGGQADLRQGLRRLAQGAGALAQRLHPANRRSRGDRRPTPGLVSRRRPGLFRLAFITLLLLAILAPALPYPARHQAVLFVADLSASTRSARPAMERFIRSAIESKGPDDLAGVLVIGEDAALEAPISTAPQFTGFTTVLRPDWSDLARGLRLGAALLPAGYRPRIVLLSDGQENLGNAALEAERLRAKGIRVDVVDLPLETGPEALIRSLAGPTALRQGEKLQLTAHLAATVQTTATLRLYRESDLIQTRSLQLQAGDQSLPLDLGELPPGLHRIWATLDAEPDGLNQNNEAALMVQVGGAPSILIVEGRPGAGENLARALTASGMQVERRGPSGLPTHATQLVRYASVVLVDVQAQSMGLAAMDALATYVRQSGHGLVTVGGEQSYALGGWSGTPLETILPVTMEAPQRKELPPVAVALLIENFESQEKINTSKEAGKALVDLLTPRDTILVGDATLVGGWVVKPTLVADKAAIKAQIDGMAPGDPPDYMGHLEAAAAELEKVDAKLKHIVLAGDGDAQGISFSQYATRVAAIAAKGITISTVHVNWLHPGEERLMQLIASVGRGRYYLAQDVNVAPQIFLKEAQQISRPAAVEERFQPAIVSRSSVLQGVGGLPPLDGYVATTPKPTAQVVLQSAQGDPVLAIGQAGLGRVATWTSDLDGRWSRDLVGSAAFQVLVSNLVGWSLPPADGGALRTRASVAGGRAQLTVQLPAEGLPGLASLGFGSGTGSANSTGAAGGAGSTGAAAAWPPNLTAGVIRPDGSTQVLTLPATGPGQYAGSIPAEQRGPYVVKLSAGTKVQSVQLGETFLVVPYSPEFAAAGT
ncbi:MAG TPA: VWA domain-containing protein, partial [Symbiobacteriaceae bacterium]|nr:VWA domain-containing protein [Symbiobacteriaceae bacterium]